MTTPAQYVLRAARRKPLAACVGACFALATPALCANTITVTRCDDNGIPGDLRHGVVAAGEGDTVDMSQLTSCLDSTISLLLGELATSNDITLLGPGKDSLVISGKLGTSRIIEHTGSGTLTIKNITLAYGTAIGYAYGGPFAGESYAAGGCILSTGSVSLDHAAVHGCTANLKVDTTEFGSIAGGGGIVATNLSLTYSSVYGNTAKGSGERSQATGGGAVVSGDFTADHSSIVGNEATATKYGRAGGLLVGHNATIDGSTIALNTASHYVGGVSIYGGTSALITNSTISGNTAMAATVGGIQSGNSTTTIENTTIAFNHAGTGSNSSGTYAAGLALVVPSDAVSVTVDLQSTLIANNTYGAEPIEHDISAHSDTSVSATVSGANNLVGVSTVSLPDDTIAGACPLLGPLRDNGGPTWTHALLSHSRGIDEGNNSAALANDQRGPPYARVSGGIADIGAYEVQQDEIVFNAGFDGCH